MVLNVEPDEELQSQFKPINPFSVGIQSTVDYSFHSVNTETVQTKPREIAHKEGSWPAGTDPTNAPSCKQVRGKAEKNPTFVPQLKTMAATAEKAAKINVTIDLFADHFEAAENPQSVSDPSLRTITIMRDKHPGRFVSCLSWSTESSTRRVAICYSPNHGASPATKYDSYIYNLECSSVPEYELHPHSPLLCLEFNAKDPNFIVGGMTHGSLGLWDLRAGPLPHWTSAIENSHREGVYAVRWISSKTAFECCSVSADGSSMTWDTRNQTSPLEVVELLPNADTLPPGLSPPFAGRCLDYHTAVPTKLMVGTTEGIAMTVNRKAADASQRISNVFVGHFGPVYSVKRHPTETKYFATVSDWTTRIWSEDNKSPIMYLPAQRNYLTGAVWGTGRTSVLYTTNNVGTVHAWDLLQGQKAPICSISVGSVPIRSIAIENAGKYLITGDAIGTSTLLELNEPLQNISAQEKSQFMAMLSREAKRVKNYDQFLKEQRIRLQKQPGESTAAAGAAFDQDAIDEEFASAMRGETEKSKGPERVKIGGDAQEEVSVSQAVQDTASSAAQEGKPTEPTATEGKKRKVKKRIKKMVGDKEEEEDVYEYEDEHEGAEEAEKAEPEVSRALEDEYGDEGTLKIFGERLHDTTLVDPLTRAPLFGPQDGSIPSKEYQVNHDGEKPEILEMYNSDDEMSDGEKAARDVDILLHEEDLEFESESARERAMKEKEEEEARKREEEEAAAAAAAQALAEQYAKEHAPPTEEQIEAEKVVNELLAEEDPNEEEEQGPVIEPKFELDLSLLPQTKAVPAEPEPTRKKVKKTVKQTVGDHEEDVEVYEYEEEPAEGEAKAETGGLGIGQAMVSPGAPEDGRPPSAQAPGDGGKEPSAPASAKEASPQLSAKGPEGGDSGLQSGDGGKEPSAPASAKGLDIAGQMPSPGASGDGGKEPSAQLSAKGPDGGDSGLQSGDGGKEPSPQASAKEPSPQASAKEASPQLSAKGPEGGDSGLQSGDGGKEPSPKTSAKGLDVPDAMKSPEASGDGGKEVSPQASAKGLDIAGQLPAPEASDEKSAAPPPSTGGLGIGSSMTGLTPDGLQGPSSDKPT